MSLTTRYVLREYFKIFFLTLGALVLIYLSIEFVEKIRKFHAYHPPAILVFQYFLNRLPRFIFDLTPLALLISTLITFGGLSKNNEITAFKSSGISIFALATPLLVFAFGISVLFYFLNGSLIPSSYERSKIIRFEKIQGKKRFGDFAQNRIWLRLDNRTIFNIQVINPDKKTMRGVHIYYLGDDYKLPKEIEAEGLSYEDGEWFLSNGIHREFQPDGSIQVRTFDRETIPLNKKPEDFQQVAVKSNEMTAQKLQSYINQLTTDGFDATRYQVDLRAKEAFPFVNFMMILLGIPFALKDNRSAGLARGISISLCIAFFYWLVFSITVSLGHIGALPPWLAAWSANILLLIIGSYLFLNIRQ
ncbi:MAG: LPS export ABC transporter permease LptG [Nitrospira sp.]|nr:LPS export ABC transporter permease LptG [Candidatus Manganitrophaceae bacterium]HIL34544.1 LPS export ABC transporter permease LptG [Candidatus Manganitrophaceae bacterium]